MSGVRTYGNTPHSHRADQGKRRNGAAIERLTTQAPALHWPGLFCAIHTKFTRFRRAIV